MALDIGDRIENDLGRARWRAKDSDTGDGVAITISLEALADKGEAACLEKAREKYNASGAPVDVTTGDF